jgi:biotin transport system substrate-specific component
MEASIKKTTLALPTFLISSLAGGALIALLGLIKIPFNPIPFTLQTLAIIILGLTQRPTQAFGSAVAYLIAASVGLPVLNGGVANAAWILGPTVGYLVAFPFAASLISFLKTRIHPLLAIFLGQALIFASGFAVLAPLYGTTIAWTQGVVMFLASDALKGVAAYSAFRLWKK